MGLGTDRPRNADNSRIPTVDIEDTTFTWRNQSATDRGVGTVVTHTRGEQTVSIEFLDEDVEVPVQQVRWLAEVLLQVSDFYRERYAGQAGDDYVNPHLGERERR